jgi:hypothetical protein
MSEAANMELVPMVGGELERERSFRITPTGVVFTKELTKEEFRELIGMFKVLGDSYDICLGTTLRAGMEWYGKEYVEGVLEQAEFPYAAAVRALVLSQMELDFTEWTGLTGDHYHVLGLAFRGDATLQEKWAQETEKHHLSPRALKRSIERGEVVTDAQIEEESGGHSGGFGYLDELALAYSQWSRRVGGKKAVMELPRDEKIKWLGSVQPIVELAEEVEASLDEGVEK